MEEKYNNENGEELIDLDEKGNPLQKKEEKKPEIIKNNTQFSIILISITLIGFVLIMFIMNKKNIVYLQFKTIEEVYRNAGDAIINYINKKPNARIGLQMREELIDLYEYLIDKYEKGEVSFKDVKFYSLDGLCGLKKDSNNSFYFHLEEYFLNKTDYKKENLFLIKEEGFILLEFEKNADDYELLLINNPIDLQILTFEENGNIGFNGPYSDFDLYTHIVRLTPEVRKKIREDFFSLEKTPRYAITQGVKSILETKEIIVIANGKEKSRALKILMNNVFTKKYPITALTKHWGKITVYFDEAAGSFTKEINQ